MELLPFALLALAGAVLLAALPAWHIGHAGRDVTLLGRVAGVLAAGAGLAAIV
ncbi:hypothetical protein [Aquincola tertiaricarbonis]|uniref:hypothetical protein n=1 Tax=Aquincola tertiaricarbonis TaxID=391953 RepID=UPI0012ED8374|nr:hypothetical protein [Aquincola tertiaricarbonis]